MTQKFAPVPVLHSDCLLTVLTVVGVNCLLLLCQHSQTVEGKSLGGGGRGREGELLTLGMYNLKEELLLPLETVT